jgi:hypothetical protein
LVFSPIIVPLLGVTARLRCPGSIPPCGDGLQHVAFEGVAPPICGSLMSVIPQNRPGAAVLGRTGLGRNCSTPAQDKKEGK